jgi:hypothetical protein
MKRESENKEMLDQYAILGDVRAECASCFVFFFFGTDFRDGTVHFCSNRRRQS